MKLFSSYYNKIYKSNLLTSELNYLNFKNLKFKHNFENLATMFSLRMYYVSNSIGGRERYKYTKELESLHNEINYITSRSTLLRGFFIFALMYLYIEFAIGNNEDKNDWNGKWEMKHYNKVYKGLDEGGVEGDEEV